MGFRRRLLMLTTVLMALVAGAGVVAAVLFERALDRVVALEADSGRVLRSVRDMQYLLLRQRSRFVELQHLSAGGQRDALVAEFRATRAQVLGLEQVIEDATRGDPEVEARTREFRASMQKLREHGDARKVLQDPVELAEFMATESSRLGSGTEQLLDALIGQVRARQAGQMQQMQHRLGQQLRLLTIGFVAVVVLAGGVLLWFLDKNFARPMERATRIAGDVAAGRMQQRIPVDSDDEFGVFARAFNRMLEELTGINQRLEEANRDLESFSYTISHDLRAPLRSINGFAEILREEAGARLDAEHAAYLARIGAAATRMAAMIQDMLEIARIGRGELRAELLDASRMAAEVVAELRAVDAERRVEVAIEPDVQVYGDAGLLRVVLDNLIGNAWKYTARSAAPRIEFGRHTSAAEAGFFVGDNGAGFDPAFAANLFRPFKRLHTDTEFKGTGIGLATVQRIVLRHGGHVQASARPGQGARFEVVLPPQPVAGH